ncbi:uncharacterized short protein YbdD (DUF466 family) [Cytobacillus horneckiae]
MRPRTIFFIVAGLLIIGVSSYYAYIQIGKNKIPSEA